MQPTASNWIFIKRLFDEHPDKFHQVDDQKSLEIVIAAWQKPDPIEAQPAIGLVLLMEGAEGIRSPGRT